MLSISHETLMKLLEISTERIPPACLADRMVTLHLNKKMEADVNFCLHSDGRKLSDIQDC